MAPFTSFYFLHLFASRDDVRGSSEFECWSFGQVWAGPRGETLSWKNKEAWRIQDSEGEDGGDFGACQRSREFSSDLRCSKKVSAY